ncbi:MAG TPA: hypothetical protein VHI51_13005 [Ktedonobacterales bacterium]|nr:hypothetical protein [Ktedonobacterales bacterium]
MSTVIHREAVVGPDGKIEISAPELQPGQRVSVTIEPEADDASASSTAEPSLYDLVKDLPGGRLFKTADEVDEYLRQERDSWDR